jgi:hypothetical protein
MKSRVKKSKRDASVKKTSKMKLKKVKR